MIQITEKIKRNKHLQDALFTWEQTGIYDIECTKEGVFRRGSFILSTRRKNTSLGYKIRRRIFFRVNGEIVSYRCDRLMIKAWCPHLYKEDMYITYKDGDTQNIHIDNLIVCNEKDFIKKVYENNGEKPMTFQGSKDILERMIKEFTLQKEYMETGDFANITKYIREYLYPKLYRSNILRLQGSKTKAEICTCDVIATLYERLSNNRPLYHWWNYCLAMVKRFIITGEVIDRYMKPEIKKEVEQFKSKCL